jgi:hypothetical protein
MFVYSVTAIRMRGMAHVRLDRLGCGEGGEKLHYHGSFLEEVGINVLISTLTYRQAVKEHPGVKGGGHRLL